MIRHFLYMFTMMLPGMVTAASYYVDATNGKDSNTGQSDVQAWKTVAKVNGFSFNAGDDVYFKENGIWKERLIVDWTGTPADRVLIGAYHGSGEIGVQSGSALPTLEGTWVENNLPGKMGVDSQNNCATCLPTDQWKGLLTVNPSGAGIVDAYVTIQQMRVQRSAGRGIHVDGANNVIVKDSEVYWVARSGLLKHFGADSVFKDNEVSYSGMVTSIYRPDGIGGTWPACVSMTGPTTTGLVVEGNYIHHCGGEGIGVYGAKKAYIRGNTIIGAKQGGIYFDAADQSVAEHNLVIGAEVTETNFLHVRDGAPTTLFGRRWGGMGLGIANEGIQNPSIGANSNASGSVMRNNVVMNTLDCMFGGRLPQAVANNYRVDGKFYGNTCINTGRIFNEWQAGNNTTYTTYTFKNNIFYSSVAQRNSNSSVCNVSTNNIIFDYNLWYPAYASVPAACKGSNDQSTNDPDLLGGTDWRTYNAYGMNNVPTDVQSVVEPSSSSDAVNNGVQLTATILTEASYDPADDQLDTNCNSGETDITEMKLDYTCATRSVTPTIGAIEVGVAPPSPSAESLPFHMNIGGGALGPLVSGRSYEAEQYRAADGSPASYAGTNNEAVDNTADDALYQSWRGKNGSLSWSIPIANGNYDLTLLYQEQYWGVAEGSCTAAGSNRQFDVSVEGVQVRDEFDICALAGTPSTATRDVISNISVTDGQLDIQLSLGEGQDPKPELMGLEITVAAPAPSPPTNFIVR